MMTTALSVALAASAAVAQAAPPEALRVQVTAVRASDSGPSDPKLVNLRPRLRRLVGNRSFRIVQREERPCGWRTESRFALPGGRHLKLLPKNIERDVVNMQVRLLDGRRRLVDTNIGVQNGATMLFGIGRDPRFDDDALIIMLKAEMP